MTSNGWRSLMEKDWASCVLHNLPFFSPTITKKKETISISGYKESAANWNFYDFKEKLYQKK
jgi:hypothetical protein